MKDPRKRAVLDTNVLVSALINPYGAPGRIWDLVIHQQLVLGYDDRILVEYQQVLRRGKFGFDRDSVDAILAIFQFQESVYPIRWNLSGIPDQTDLMFLEVASAAGCPLISGNLKHYPENIRGTVSVLSPNDYLDGTGCQ